MIEIAPNKFVVGSRIVAMRIYEKDNKIGIAIAMDTVNPDEKTSFAGPFASMEEAKHAVNTIGSGITK